MSDKVRNICYLSVKRLFDIVVSTVALVFVGLITIIIFLIDSFGDNKGPVFFKQKRIGKNHRPFFIYKYRSMVVDADKKLQSNSKLHELYVKNNYKLPPEKDPRITKFGKFLRKTSIDELPQFWNVFKGEMSMVGPRPIVEEELKEYGDRTDLFLSVTPGAMGYWQASGRSTIPYPERCDLELYYVEHASILFDIKIMFKSVVSIFKGDGAY
jgi:lipopolysaccharide/colanic/teichoic acid biosynthesis glycosyltransferase|nr:sugar transferase [Ligilactobacillus acidipiscis]